MISERLEWQLGFATGTDGIIADGLNTEIPALLRATQALAEYTFRNAGEECVEAKYGAERNIIEYKSCTGQKDPNSGGIVSRGRAIIIRYNEIYGSVGAGARLGGQLVDGVAEPV